MPNITDYNPRFPALNTSNMGPNAVASAARQSAADVRERARLDVDQSKQKLWPYNIMSLMRRIEDNWKVPKDPGPGVNVRIKPSGPSLMKGTGYDSTPYSEAIANAQLQREHDSINMGGRAVGELVDRAIEDPFKEVKAPKPPKWAEEDTPAGYDNQGNPIWRVKYKDPYEKSFAPQKVIETYEGADGELKTRLRQTSRESLPEKNQTIGDVLRGDEPMEYDYGGGRDLFEGEKEPSTFDWIKRALGLSSGDAY